MCEAIFDMSCELYDVELAALAVCDARSATTVICFSGVVDQVCVSTFHLLAMTALMMRCGKHHEGADGACRYLWDRPEVE